MHDWQKSVKSALREKSQKRKKVEADFKPNRQIVLAVLT
jgi:hypothetical protein